MRAGFTLGGAMRDRAGWFEGGPGLGVGGGVGSTNTQGRVQGDMDDVFGGVERVEPALFGLTCSSSLSWVACGSDLHSTRYAMLWCGSTSHFLPREAHAVCTGPCDGKARGDLHPGKEIQEHVQTNPL